MTAKWEQYLINRLKDRQVAFGAKLREVATTLPHADAMGGARMVHALLESALESRPSYGELYELCEAGEQVSALHDYLRGFFLASPKDVRCVEMAERLENIISLRSAERAGRRQDRHLHDTLAEFLLRARN